MAQILKDNVKQMIVDSAIQDIFEHGFSNSSMRRIASNAQMTVGNLYRYFKSKEEIVNYIIAPILDKLNVVIEKHTHQRIDFVNSSFDWSTVSLDAIMATLDELAVVLVDLSYHYPKSLMIMMMHGKIHQMIHEWFAKLISSFMVSKNLVTEQNQTRCNLLARSYAASLFSGVKECLLEKNIDKEEMIQVIQIYFSGCFMMLEHNFDLLEG